MAGEEYSHESRRTFMEALGTYQVIADTLGLKDRRNVANWVRAGFSHIHKADLIKMAHERGISPHPELYTTRRHNVPSMTTALGRFIHTLALKVNGFENLSELSGIPRSSLTVMCLKKGRLKRKFQPNFEYMAKIYEIPLPDQWQQILEESTPKIRPRPENTRTKRPYKKRLKRQSEDASA